jgi:cytochrome c peroxidase
MLKANKLFLGVVIVFFILAILSWNIEGGLFVSPPHFPKPTYSIEGNPPTSAGFKLGRKLFYESRLSADNTISCGSCHNQFAAFTHHGHDLSHGIYDRLGKRNAPPIMNLAWNKYFMWDGGVLDLDLQPIIPITDSNEMNESLSCVLDKLKADKEYPQLFKEAFGSTEINTEKLMKALSQFMVMLVSANAKYDSVKRQSGVVFTAEEKAGEVIFIQTCSSCHVPPLFTSDKFATNGILSQQEVDNGRFDITLDENDKGKFKIPSLRNVMLTAPYMHDGRFREIDDVLLHYKKKYNMSDSSIHYLKSFLHSLTDQDFINDVRFSEQ